MDQVVRRNDHVEGALMIADGLAPAQQLGARVLYGAIFVSLILVYMVIVCYWSCMVIVCYLFWLYMVLYYMAVYGFGSSCLYTVLSYNGWVCNGKTALAHLGTRHV